MWPCPQNLEIYGLPAHGDHYAEMLHGGSENSWTMQTMRILYATNIATNGQGGSRGRGSATEAHGFLCF